MNIPDKNDIWIGLFTHLDSVARGSLDLLLKLKGMGIEEHGKEYFIDDSTFKTINKILTTTETQVGGNAGNAAFFLGNLGLDCNLSAPFRPERLMNFYAGLPVYFWGARRKTATAGIRKKDPCFEHIVIKLFKPLSNKGRTILSFDEMTQKGELDKGFWEKMTKGIFLLSGFHLIKSKKRISEIIDKLASKNMTVYLEMGEPSSSMKFAVKKLLNENLVNHIGMNEREAQKIFKLNYQNLKTKSEELECGITIHTPDYVTSTNKKMLRSSIDIVQAWAMGSFLQYKQVLSLPLKRTPKGTIAGRALPYLERQVGLGDAFSAIDAIRLFQPKKMENLISRLPFYGTDQFPSYL